MITRYQKWLDQEADSNLKILEMLDSVPESNRSDERYQQAIDLGGHLAACRSNWLIRMTGTGTEQNWWPEQTTRAQLQEQMSKYETEWRDYLQTLMPARLDEDFEFVARDGNRYRWNIEGQIMQLVGHAFFHRGQIALLVRQLGGVGIDTDYLYWAYAQDSRWGRV